MIGAAPVRAVGDEQRYHATFPEIAPSSWGRAVATLRTGHLQHGGRRSRRRHDAGQAPLARRDAERCSIPRSGSGEERVRSRRSGCGQCLPPRRSRRMVRAPPTVRRRSWSPIREQRPDHAICPGWSCRTPLSLPSFRDPFSDRAHRSALCAVHAPAVLRLHPLRRS